MAVRVAHRVVATLCAIAVWGGLGLLAPSAAAVTRPDLRPTARITPGALMLTEVGLHATTACTAGFVFRSRSATLLGYAAHCAVPVQPRHETGCEYATLPLGTPVVVRGLDGSRVQGRLAYSSWRTMRELGETDDDRCRYNDFALVEIDPDGAAAIDPTVPGVGGPTHLGQASPDRLRPVTSYQPQITRPALKQGVGLGLQGGGWSHLVDVSPSASLGDSGSGMLDAGGAAFGILATRYPGRFTTSGVTDLPRALAYAESHGGLGPLDLVPGSTPYHGPAERPVLAAR